jgi:hypothetical protein
MTWHVQVTRSGGAAEVLRFSTPELAIEAACRMLDEDSDVFGIGTGPLRDSIDRDQIRRIYEIWLRGRPRIG